MFAILGLVAMGLKPSEQECLDRIEHDFRLSSIAYIDHHNVVLTPSKSLVFRPVSQTTPKDTISHELKYWLVEDFVRRGMARVKVVDCLFFKKIVGKQLQEEKSIGFAFFNKIFITIRKPKYS